MPTENSQDQETDAYQAPFPTDDTGAIEDDPQAVKIAMPYVGRWNELISTTNWEKGRIISQWRVALVESGADASQFCDDAWARRVGGVTAPHVGRLRRVFDRYGSTYDSYDGLSWTHFLAALDWDDAPLWLEGAAQEGWSVTAMREQRWQANGAVDSKRPTNAEIVEVDTDEDVVVPAQGGRRTKEYGDDPSASTGKTYENADFGDEEELTSIAGSSAISAGSEPDSNPTAAVQPFAGLPELPDDLSDAIEMLKLAVLRHKSGGWQDTDAETIQKYLNAVATLMTA